MREPIRRYGPASPLDAADPRFEGLVGAERRRELVESQGPGPSPLDTGARTLRLMIPLTALAGLAGVVAVFFLGLDPGDGQQVVGPEALVRAQVAERPKRVCYDGAQPCAWITLVDGELVGFLTDGPLPGEFGRMGVSWCPSSGYFGSNTTGSRFDAHGNVVSGPSPRGLDRVRLVLDDAGRLHVHFFARTTGLQIAFRPEPVPPTGPDCQRIPFDREADLVLPAT